MHREVGFLGLGQVYLLVWLILLGGLRFLKGNRGGVDGERTGRETVVWMEERRKNNLKKKERTTTKKEQAIR